MTQGHADGCSQIFGASENTEPSELEQFDESYSSLFTLSPAILYVFPYLIG